MRLAMLDVDGTLKHETEWMPGARDLIRALDEAGIAVALCSGRELRSLRTTADELGCVRYLAGAGGSLAMAHDGGEWRVVGERRLPREVVDEVMRGTERLGMELWAYTDSAWLVRERTPRVIYDEGFTHAQAQVGDASGRDDIIKLLLFCENPEQEAFRREITGWDGIGVASSYPGYWDVLPEQSLATKGGDLLTEAFGCTWAETIAAGDGSNDLGMLSRAGLAYLLAPRRVAELEPGDGERVEVGEIAGALEDLRRRGIVG